MLYYGGELVYNEWWLKVISIDMLDQINDTAAW